MTELKCPSCGKVFQVDKSDYAALLQQVRNHEFDEELEKRLNEKLTIAQQKFDREIAELKHEVGLANERQENALTAQKAELDKKQSDELAKKNAEITRLNGELKAAETQKDLAVEKANSASKEQILGLNSRIKELEEKAKTREEIFELEKKNAVTELEGKLDSQKNEYEAMLKLKENELAQVKDYRKMLTTKMVGESLERHCEDEFNKLRMTAFPNAYFAKDNAVSESGSKGDYIYREEIDGVELISIMFEMKNENDTTKSKHRNKDFFKELDKDRHEKGCEYAILVSMLEQDSEYYNAGIVDVSYEYEKMYVIRPQFFIPMITLLRNAALKSLETKKQLDEAQKQNIDLTNFEENMEKFKSGFARNYELARSQYEKAIKEIDDAIKKLQAVKTDLTKSADNLRLANDKAQEQLTIKKLTKNAPLVREMLDTQKQAALDVTDDSLENIEN